MISTILIMMIGAMVGFGICSLVTITKMKTSSNNMELGALRKEISYLTEHVSGFKSSIATIDNKLDLGMKDIRTQLNSIKSASVEAYESIDKLTGNINELNDSFECMSNEFPDMLKGIDENVEQIYDFTENTKKMAEEIKYHITDDGQNFEAIKSDLATITEEAKGIRELKSDLDKVKTYLLQHQIDDIQLRDLICRQTNNLKNHIRNRKR